MTGSDPRLVDQSLVGKYGAETDRFAVSIKAHDDGGRRRRWVWHPLVAPESGVSHVQQPGPFADFEATKERVLGSDIGAQSHVAMLAGEAERRVIGVRMDPEKA
jgi:hypothetical protein